MLFPLVVVDGGIFILSLLTAVVTYLTAEIMSYALLVSCVPDFLPGTGKIRDVLFVCLFVLTKLQLIIMEEKEETDKKNFRKGGQKAGET